MLDSNWLQLYPSASSLPSSATHEGAERFDFVRWALRLLGSQFTGVVEGVVADIHLKLDTLDQLLGH